MLFNEMCRCVHSHALCHISDLKSFVLVEVSSFCLSTAVHLPVGSVYVLQGPSLSTVKLLLNLLKVFSHNVCAKVLIHAKYFELFCIVVRCESIFSVLCHTSIPSCSMLMRLVTWQSGQFMARRTVPTPSKSTILIAMNRHSLSGVGYLSHFSL